MMSEKIDDNSELFLDEITSDFTIILAHEKIPGKCSRQTLTNKTIFKNFCLNCLQKNPKYLSQ